MIKSVGMGINHYKLKQTNIINLNLYLCTLSGIKNPEVKLYVTHSSRCGQGSKTARATTK